MRQRLHHRIDLAMLHDWRLARSSPERAPSVVPHNRIVRVARHDVNFQWETLSLAQGLQAVNSERTTIYGSEYHYHGETIHMKHQL